jgi:hypothetical protein
MSTRISRAVVAFATLAVLAGPVTSAHAQGKIPKASSRPGAVTFGCAYSTSAPDQSCANGDAIAGDGGSYAGTGVPESGAGAHLRDNGELWIGLRDGGMRLRLDFSQAAAVAPCVSAANCRFDAAFAGNDYFVIAGGYAEVNSNVVGASNENDTTPTLSSMAMNATLPTRLNISFNDPKYGLLWGFNFNPAAYAGSGLVQVTRTSACTWEFSAPAGTLAGLSAYGRGPNGGKSYRTDEGLYYAPFAFVFTVPSLCPQ